MLSVRLALEECSNTLHELSRNVQQGLEQDMEALKHWAKAAKERGDEMRMASACIKSAADGYREAEKLTYERLLDISGTGSVDGTPASGGGTTPTPGGGTTTIPGGGTTTIPGGGTAAIPGGSTTTIPGGGTMPIPGGPHDQAIAPGAAAGPFVSWSSGSAAWNIPNAPQDWQTLFPTLPGAGGLGLAGAGIGLITQFFQGSGGASGSTPNNEGTSDEENGTPGDDGNRGGECPECGVNAQEGSGVTALIEETFTDMENAVSAEMSPAAGTAPAGGGRGYSPGAAYPGFDPYGDTYPGGDSSPSAGGYTDKSADTSIPTETSPPEETSSDAGIPAETPGGAEYHPAPEERTRLAAPLLGGIGSLAGVAAGMGINSQTQKGGGGDMEPEGPELPVVKAEQSGGLFSGDLKGGYFLLGTGLSMMFSGMSLAAGVRNQNKDVKETAGFRIGYGESAILTGGAIQERSA
jgi:hypothetical protein